MLEKKIPPVPLALICGGAMYGLFSRGVYPVLGGQAANILGLALFISGAVFCVLGASQFRKLRTTLSPIRTDECSTLVVSGVYRFTRNPMYFGLLQVLVGWGLALGDLSSIAVSLLFVPYMNRFQIAPEEASLVRTFGESYSSYKDKVRRWI